MAVLAVGLAFMLVDKPSAQVFFACHRLKMIWVHTCADSAQMIKM